MSPDITMCNGKECPKKEKCYRYTAKPCEWQSFFDEAPIESGKCKYFWSNHDRVGEGGDDASD